MDVWEGVGAFAEAGTFCKLWGIEGTVLVDEAGTLVEQLGIRGVPTNFLVDTDGTITCVGASTPRELERAVQDLLGPDTPLGGAAASADWHWQTGAAQTDEQLTDRATRAEARPGPPAPGPHPRAAPAGEPRHPRPPAGGAPARVAVTSCTAPPPTPRRFTDEKPAARISACSRGGGGR